MVITLDSVGASGPPFHMTQNKCEYIINSLSLSYLSPPLPLVIIYNFISFFLLYSSPPLHMIII